MGVLSNFRLISSGVEEILNSAETRAFLTDKAEAVLSSAQAGAPVVTGAYAASLHIEQDTTDRAAVRVVADVDYAMIVEANTGNLAQAMDAAG